MQKKVIVLLFILIGILSYGDIISAHNKALNIWREDLGEAIKIMEENGIKDIIKSKPKKLSKNRYINILNDYAFFLSKTKDRYKEAIPVLEKVIDIRPNRAVAYLNLGDLYYKLDNDKLVYYNYYKYKSLLKKDAKIPEKVTKVLKQKSLEEYERMSDTIKNLKTLKYEMKNNINYFEESKKIENIDKYAEQFYQDFLNNENIEFISPVYTTDNINDDEFQEYLKIYSIKDFEQGKPDPNISLKYASLNETKAHYNYKTYQIDIDNNPKNGLEDIFYSSGFWNEESGENSRYSNYRMFNRNESPGKQFLGGQSVDCEYYGKEKIKTGSYNGIVKYNKEYYIYEIEKKYKYYMIEIYKWQKNGGAINIYFRIIT